MKLKNRAVSLIELVMVIMVVGVLVGVSSLYIKQLVDTWQFLTFRNEMVSEGRAALMRMEREFRQVLDASSVYTATSTMFEFDDMNNNRISYWLSGNNLMRNSDILADSVTSLAFAYFDKNNNLVAAPVVFPGQTDIYRITITLSLQSGNQSKILRSQVVPKNF
jgi:prepilin-type N-terminal cleavage/methylation domain-containing protein